MSDSKLIQLPPEILYHIFLYLTTSAQEFRSFACSCNTLRYIALIDNLQEIAKNRISKKIEISSSGYPVHKDVFYVLPNKSKHGQFQKFQGNKLKMQYYYKDNKLHGDFFIYDNDSMLIENTKYHNDVKEGLSTVYYKNGNPKHIKNYKEGQLHGKFKKFNETGVIYWEVDWQDGKRHGESVAYFPSGKISLHSNYVNNYKHGIEEEFFENGQLAKRINYDLNREDGPMEEFFENGKLRLKAIKKKCLYIGRYEEYYENGQLFKKANYNDYGEMCGEYEEYKDNGELFLKLDKGNPMLDPLKSVI